MYRLFAPLIWVCTGLILGSVVGRLFGVCRPAWKWVSRAFIFGCYYFWELPDFLIGFSADSPWPKLLCKGPRVCILRGSAALSSFSPPHTPATARRLLVQTLNPASSHSALRTLYHWLRVCYSILSI